MCALFFGLVGSVLGTVRDHSQKLQNDPGATRSRLAVILSEAKDLRSVLLRSAPHNEPRRFFAQNDMLG
jgi:hypothetical protein